MTSVAVRPEAVRDAIVHALGDAARDVHVLLGEVIAVVPAARYHEAMKLLRDAPACRFEQLVDLCGMDHSTYGDIGTEGARYSVADRGDELFILTNEGGAIDFRIATAPLATPDRT